METIKISGNIKKICKSLHLSLDFRQLPSSVHRITIADVENLKIHDLIIRQSETIDISFRRIHKSLTVTGEMTCPDCSPQEITNKQIIKSKLQSIGSQLDSTGDIQTKNQLKPKIKFQILKAGNVTFDNFVTGMGYRSNVRIQMRDAESVTIQDSYFNDLPSNGMEIFNVDNVTIFHSEFYNGSKNSIVVNGGVKNVHVKDCLMDRRLILPLDQNSTDIYFRCTTSPNTFIADAGSNYLKDEPECVSKLSKWIGPNPAGVESTGAVVLAIVSALLLVIAIGFLFVLHRTGRLDQYI